MSFLQAYFERFMDAAPGLTIPLWQSLAFVVVTRIAALCQRYSLTLILSYVLLSYRVFFENKELLTLNLVWIVTGFVFVGFGLVAVLLTIHDMLTSRG